MAQFNSDFLYLGKMENASLDRNRLIFRIYRWPLSYFVGLLIGLLVSCGFALFSASLWEKYEKVGVYLLLSGGCLVIAGFFGEGMESFLELPPRGKLEKLIRRLSVLCAGVFIVVAWTFFVTTGKPNGGDADTNKLIPEGVD